MKGCLLLKYKIKTEQEIFNYVFMRKELAGKTAGPLRMSFKSKDGPAHTRLGPVQIPLESQPLGGC